ncbi:MAG: UDP-N-acetylmuramate dehydrogenase [Thermoanaerobaculales bacterium]|jgi:UDP-N-acetylmuramate dehydrogenase|nr:UDP-N-acetylmuramate dehydrogenase [Thermoanaerobaculales bacterium]
MIAPKNLEALGPRTTLEVGGDAEHFVEAVSVDELRDALVWARERDQPVTILGGGSNLVVADEGLRGLTVALAIRGLEIERRRHRTTLTVAAGEPWDDVVAAAVSENLAGIECLSGIPGTAGATPIQNVGAYGQEVASVIAGVRVLHRKTLEERELAPADCGFGYRSSVLKQPGNPWVVTQVRFGLQPGGSPCMKYLQVAERFPGSRPPSLGELRAAVIELRRDKSMVLDEADPNRRSAGSFFTNPVVDADVYQGVAASARALGVLGLDEVPPGHPVGEGGSKLSAGWLIERAGFPRGAVRGNVGLSTKHALALINRGGATAAELVAFAAEIRRGVRSHLGVDLTPEPVFLGFDTQDPTA